MFCYYKHKVLISIYMIILLLYLFLAIISEIYNKYFLFQNFDLYIFLAIKNNLENGLKKIIRNLQFFFILIFLLLSQIFY